MINAARSDAFTQRFGSLWLPIAWPVRGINAWAESTASVSMSNAKFLLCMPFAIVAFVLAFILCVALQAVAGVVFSLRVFLRAVTLDVFPLTAAESGPIQSPDADPFPYRALTPCALRRIGEEVSEVGNVLAFIAEHDDTEMAFSGGAYITPCDMRREQTITISIGIVIRVTPRP